MRLPFWSIPLLAATAASDMLDQLIEPVLLLVLTLTKPVGLETDFFTLLMQLSVKCKHLDLLKQVNPHQNTYSQVLSRDLIVLLNFNASVTITK